MRLPKRFAVGKAMSNGLIMIWRGLYSPMKRTLALNLTGVTCPLNVASFTLYATSCVDGAIPPWCGAWHMTVTVRNIGQCYYPRHFRVKSLYLTERRLCLEYSIKIYPHAYTYGYASPYGLSIFGNLRTWTLWPKGLPWVQLYISVENWYLRWQLIWLWNHAHTAIIPGVQIKTLNETKRTVYETRGSWTLAST